MGDYLSELRREEHEQDLQRLRGLRPIDDDFMRQLFRGNHALAEMVLQIITGISDLKLIEMQTQKDYKRLVGARSLCLDVYAKDSKGRLYDLEIQRADSGARPHRARYHASAMDIENLDAGQDFEDLPITYIIFITENDLFGQGAALYPIERINMQTGSLFDDGTHILYVNGAFRGDSDLGMLMHDFSCSDPDDMYFQPLAERTRYFKENPKGVSQMCKVLEDMRNETARRTKEETTLNLIKALMQTLNINSQDAMEKLLIPLEERPFYATHL